MSRWYAGVGSRQTPANVLAYFTTLAGWLHRERGYILRSGGAPGADTAFEAGAPPTAREIFLPWMLFNGNGSMHYRPPALAYQIASLYHPAWDRLPSAVRALMARNTQQVLGPNCDTPSDFVICWTIGASGKGGTGQAIRIATAYKIPVFDFGNPVAAITDLREYLTR
jgi:hypothetical protein